MANYNWILTKDLLKDDRRKRFIDIRDTSILIVLSLLTGILSIGALVVADTPEKLYSQNGILIGKYLLQYNTVPNWYVAVPLFLFFLILLLLFFIFRYKETKVLPNKIITTIGIILFIGSVIGLFFFSPKGDYTYISPIENETFNSSITVSYSGLELSGKIYESIALLLLGSYFIFVFTYVKTLSNYVVPIVRLALFVPIIIAFVLIIYSFINEGWKWDNNFKYLLKKVVEIANIQSLANHKNMFGFFLLLASFSSLIFFSKHHNILFYFLTLFFLVCTILIFSKASVALILLSFTLTSFIYIFTNFKSHKFNSLICLIVIVLSLIAISIVSYLLIKNGFLDKFKNHNTLDFRINHFYIAQAMFKNQPISRWIFGYGRIPFTSLYMNFETQIGFEVLWTTHNCYMETLAHYGLIGLLGILLCDSYVLYCISYLVFKKKQKECAVYYPVFLILCIYSFFEPRMLFLLSSGSEVFLFYFIILFPVFIDYGHSKNNEVLI